jgi:hypothetical protein
MCTMSKLNISGNIVVDILSMSIILWFLVSQVVLQCNSLGDFWNFPSLQGRLTSLINCLIIKIWFHPPCLFYPKFLTFNWTISSSMFASFPFKIMLCKIRQHPTSSRISTFKLDFITNSLKVFFKIFLKLLSTKTLAQESFLLNKVCKT